MFLYGGYVLLLTRACASLCELLCVYVRACLFLCTRVYAVHKVSMRTLVLPSMAYVCAWCHSRCLAAVVCTVTAGSYCPLSTGSSSGAACPAGSYCLGGSAAAGAPVRAPMCACACFDAVRVRVRVGVRDCVCVCVRARARALGLVLSFTFPVLFLCAMGCLERLHPSHCWS
jgi:hypothetical protein